MTEITRKQIADRVWGLKAIQDGLKVKEPDGTFRTLSRSDELLIACEAMLTAKEGECERLRKNSAWISTKDRLPEKPGIKDYEYVDCLVYYKKEVLIRPWNCEHLCWDRADYDDWFCNSTDVDYWMPLPECKP